jgi:regulator of replication initiation timing
MIREDALRDILIQLAIACKSSAQENAHLMIEVAALRETVSALDPTFSETFENRQEEKKNQVSEQFSPALRSLDGLVQKLKAGEVC